MTRSASCKSIWLLKSIWSPKFLRERKTKKRNQNREKGRGHLFQTEGAAGVEGEPSPPEDEEADAGVGGAAHGRVALDVPTSQAGTHYLRRSEGFTKMRRKEILEMRPINKHKLIIQYGFHETNIIQCSNRFFLDISITRLDKEQRFRKHSQ